MKHSNEKNIKLMELARPKGKKGKAWQKVASGPKKTLEELQEDFDKLVNQSGSEKPEQEATAERGEESVEKVVKKPVEDGGDGQEGVEHVNGDGVALASDEIESSLAASADGVHRMYAEVSTGVVTDVATTAAADSASAGAVAEGAGTAAEAAGAGTAAAGGIEASTVALGALGTVGVAGGTVAIVASSAGGGAAAAAGTAAAATVTTVISGTIALGPTVSSNNLKVTLYKADGSSLGSSTVDSSGKYSVDIGAYSGKIIAQVTNVTSDGTADYWDEATNSAVDLSADLLGFGSVTSGVSATLNINAVTTIAAKIAGIASASGTLNASGFNESSTANTDVGTAFGLGGDVTKLTAVTAVTSSGATQTPNTLGVILAALSGVGDLQTTLTSFASNISGTKLTDAGVKSLIQGAATSEANNTATAGVVSKVFEVLTTSSNTGLTVNLVDSTVGSSSNSSANNIINNSEKNSGVTLGGSVPTGATAVTVSIDGGAAITATIGSNGTWSLAGQTSALCGSEGTHTLTITATLSGGGTATTSSYYVVDTVGPTAAPTLTLGAGVGVSNGATSAEATAAAGVVTVSGESGATIAVTFTNGPKTVTKTVIGTGSAQAVVLTSADLTTLGDGTISVSAIQKDAAGNASSAGTTSFTLDTAAPNAPTLVLGTGVSDGATSAEATAAAGVVTVSGESGATIAVTFTNGSNTVTKTLTGTGSAQAVVLTSADLTTLGDGAISVKAVATDAAGNASSAGTASFTLDTVAPTVSPGTFSVNENLTSVGTLAANETVTWSLGTGGDTALFALNGNTLSFINAKDYETESSHTYTVNVIATDTAGNQTTKTITVNSADINEAPTAVGSVSDQAAVVGQAFSYTVPTSVFNDQDTTAPNNTLTWSATLADGSALPSWLTFNASTHTFSGTAPSTGSVQVKVTVTDGGGLSATQSFTINEVTAPVVSSVAATNDVYAGGSALTFTVTMTEAVTVTGAPTITFTMNGQTVTATYAGGTGTSALTFTATAPTSGDGSNIAISAINLNGGSVVGNTTSQGWVTTSVGQTVSGVIIDNSAPTFTSATTASFNENGTGVAYTAVATDVSTSKYALTYTLTGTDASLFNIDSTGNVTFKTTPNYESPSDSGSDNVYNVTVSATDHLGKVSTQNVAITVNDVNEAPTTSGTIATQTAVTNNSSTFSFDTSSYFSDPDTNTSTANASWHTLTYSASSLPSGFSINSTTGVITGTATTVGTSHVTVTATDGGGLTTTQTFDINSVQAPTLSSNIAGVSNLDVRSNIVFTSSEALQLSSSGTYTIKIINDANDTAKAGFHSEVSTNSQTITITNGVVSGGGVSINGNVITIDPLYDLDLSNNYHIEISAGAFVGTTSSAGSLAVSGLTFSTVTPGTAFASAAVSQSMTSTGALASSLQWFDGSNLGSLSTATPQDYDLSGGNYAMALKYDSTTTTATGPITDADTFVQLKNFGASDLLYVDIQDNAVVTSGFQIIKDGTFAGGVGTSADPYSASYGSTGTLGNAMINFVLDSASQALLPTSATLPTGDLTLTNVISTGWSTTGMVIAA